MKRLFTAAIIAAFTLGATALTSCDNGDGPGEEDTQITLPNAGDKNQTTYADDDAAKGFTFTAKAAWTATVKEGTATRASEVSWLRLLLNGTETYSGAAGTFNMAIEVDMNLTGKDRSATITVTSGTDEISVTVTQKGVKEDNTPLTAKDLLVALPWKHVSTTMKALDGPDEGETEVLDGAYTLTFKNDGTITVVGQDQDEFTDFFGLDPLPTYSLSGSGDKLTWIVASDEPQDSPNSVEFDVVKLTASELEFTVIDVVHVAEDSGDGNGLNEYDYNQSFTVKLTRGDGGGTKPPVSGDSQLLTAHSWEHVSTLYEYTQPADEEDVVEDAPYTVTFETNGTITIVDADGEPFGSYLLNGEGNTWSVADDILTMHFIEEDENVPFTIVKLTDTELELKVVGIEEEWEDSEGNSGVDIFDMTMKFVKP